MSTPYVGQIVECTIDSLGSHGEGVGRYAGYTLFIEGALPQEQVQVRLTHCSKNYGRAELITILTASPQRITPPCPLFERCGGCQIMHLDYKGQLAIKRQKVIDALQRIGKFTDIDVAPCHPSPDTLAYRNKIQLPAQTTEHGLTLGLYARSSHSIVEVDKCYIHCTLGETVFQRVTAILKRMDIDAYDSQTGRGLLRHLLIKSAVKTNEALVILVTNSGKLPLLEKVAKAIMRECPAVKGVVHNDNRSRDNVILGTKYASLAGAMYIHERLGHLTFKVSPASFFQVNPAQAEQLYSKALALANLQGHEIVLDAYCGVGTLSLFFASKASRVIAVECIPQAIEDAKENARLNNIENVAFTCADAAVYIQTLSTVDVVVVNPPRKGCDPSFLQALIRLRPSQVIYISCDPATLARDLAYLCSNGFAIDAVHPYDMFPQTAHVECITKLRYTSLT
jgi:23S rRNA (uracil1939-C5)-methyltransferase